MNRDQGIEIHGLNWAYAEKIALHAIDLSIRTGHFTVLLGPNGAGKSTLVSLLSGLITSSRGKVEIRGFDMSVQPRSALASMGFVFQQPTLDLDLSVEQNMYYFAAIRGISGRRAREGIEKNLQRMGLADRSKEKTRSLNGGHRRRLEIARALIHAPEILVLDEPTTGLDVPSRSALVDHLHSLCGDEGLTVLWATHLVDEVWNSDDLVVLDHGRIVAQGAVAEVLSNTGSKSVLQAFNRLTTGVGVETQHAQSLP